MKTYDMICNVLGVILFPAALPLAWAAMWFGWLPGM